METPQRKKAHTTIRKRGIFDRKELTVKAQKAPIILCAFTVKITHLTLRLYGITQSHRMNSRWRENQQPNPAPAVKHSAFNSPVIFTDSSLSLICNVTSKVAFILSEPMETMVIVPLELGVVE